MHPVDVDRQTEVSAAVPGSGGALDEAVLRDLRRTFRGELLQPGDPGYDAARRVWNATVDRRPVLIARCTGTADVLTALRFSRDEGLAISVRGGGHSVAGHAVLDGGLMIDLSPMKGIRVDPEARRASVQSGCLWSEVDRETQQFGLATTGGVVSQTGVAGLTLGGGQGWLARKHGYSCDNLVAADVVTADGGFVVADADRNTDLFWGLRGGGGNFGIVTSFQFRLHEVGPQVLTGQLFYAPEEAVRALEAFREFVAGAPDEMTCTASVWTAAEEPHLPERAHGRPVVMLGFVFVGDVEAGERVAAPLRRIAKPLAELVGPMPYTVLQAQGDEYQRHGLRRFWKSQYLWDLPNAALETFLGRGPVSPGEPLLGGVTLLSLGGAIAHVGEDDTAVSHRNAAFDVMVSSTWADPADDDRHMGWARRFHGAMAPFSRGVYINNFGSEGEERIRAAYGPTKYERLVALKHRYDPDNVFRHNQNIRPSSSRLPG
jgi:FAD/FMN-containing dehydrogenase